MTMDEIQGRPFNDNLNSNGKLKNLVTPREILSIGHPTANSRYYIIMRTITLITTFQLLLNDKRDKMEFLLVELAFQ